MGATRIVSRHNGWSLNVVGLPTLPILLINQPCTIGLCPGAKAQSLGH